MVDLEKRNAGGITNVPGTGSILPEPFNTFFAESSISKVRFELLGSLPTLIDQDRKLSQPA